MWINRYMVALAIGLGAAAGIARLHGDLFALLLPTVLSVIMVIVGAIETRRGAGSDDRPH